MKCDQCKTETASVHLKRIVGKKILSLNLCSGCAKMEGFDDSGDGQFNLLAVLHVIAQKAAQLEMDILADESDGGNKPNPSCSACGLAFDVFSSTGLLGCPRCYEAFAAQLETPLSEMHRDTLHRGRGLAASAASTPDRLVGVEIAHLQEELSRAVATEAYEDAARLRDEIVNLQETLASRHPVEMRS